jgi:hypothetical protein
MGTAENVKLGVCNVTFGGTDLGYTKGGVSVSYSTESVEKTVDQEDVPIGEIITKQNFEVKVPMAEYDLAKFETLIPDSTLVTDSVDSSKKKLVIGGSAGTDLLNTAQELVLVPVGGNMNDSITLHHAIAVPSFEFSFEKDNVRVFEVTFKALKGANGFVTMGDATATP